jgi:uncharacterized protein YndB with AHSA1/START domain
MMSRPTTRTVRCQVFVHASPSKAFGALTRPALLTRWFVDHATIDLRKGGRYAFSWDGGPTHAGAVTEFIPGKRITLSWQWPGHEKLEPTRLRMTVEPAKSGTIVRFAHSGFHAQGPWIELHDGAIQGWTYFLMNLKSVVDHGHDLRSPLDW